MKKLNLLILSLIGASCVSCVVVDPPYTRMSGTVYVSPTHTYRHHYVPDPSCSSSWGFSSRVYNGYVYPQPSAYSNSTNFSYNRRNYGASVTIRNGYYY